MNERIRELKEQAWTLVSIEERDRGELYQAQEQWERCDQKFAELIVGECVRKIENIAESSNTPQPIYRVAVELLEHFGVEE